MSKNIKTTFGDFIFENNEANAHPVISVTKCDDGENYDVMYTITTGLDTYEFSGKLTPYDSGRSIDYEFNPNQFVDDESEVYYDENWESIEDEILKALDDL